MTRLRPRRDDFLVPRDRDAASRLLLVLTWSAAVATAGFMGLAHLLNENPSSPAYFAVPVGVALIALAFQRTTPGPRSLVWIGLPVLGVAVITALNLATSDASTAAQVFYCYPVLYAASNLRPAAAILVTAVTVIGHATVAFSLLPVGVAIGDVVFVGLALSAMCVVLVRAGRRQDMLVTRLRRRASVDPLTGLATRQAFNDAAAALLSSAGTAGPGTAVIVVDLDRFKSINDTHGHLVGDDALVQVSEVIRSCTRPDSVIGRIGGDEIVVLIPRCDRPTAQERAEAIVRAVRSHPILVDGSEALTLTISVGVAHAPAEGTTLRELFAVADSRLYTAKRDGRNQVGGVGMEQAALPLG